MGTTSDVHARNEEPAGRDLVRAITEAPSGRPAEAHWIKDASGELAGVPAGNFSEWLRGAEASLRSGKGGTAVPCGTCTACCRSSMFIHIKPEEKQTIRRIPRALLFPAPGLPKGHVLMGYSDKGHCPMLVDDKCSIYEHRPRTCRGYDCRVFTATGVPVDPRTQAEIAHRVSAWVFNYESEESRKEHTIVKDAAAFLRKNEDLFAQGSLPAHPAQLAALAVKIHRLFSGTAANMNNSAPAISDAVIAHAIMTALSEPETFFEIIPGRQGIVTKMATGWWTSPAGNAAV